jgi:hypothetical protein
MYRPTAQPAHLITILIYANSLNCDVIDTIFFGCFVTLSVLAPDAILGTFKFLQFMFFPQRENPVSTATKIINQ